MSNLNVSEQEPQPTGNNTGRVWSFWRSVAFSLAAGLVIGLVTATPAATQTPPQTATPSAPALQPGAAISQLVARNASLHDYTFDASVHVALLTFPWLRFSMSGHGQYTRNGAFTIHFDKVPWFGHGFETISMESLDPKNWPDEYFLESASTQGNDVILAMHDRKKSPLHQALVTIDQDEFVRQILWNYDNGGHVRLSIEPYAVGGFALPAEEKADIVMTGYHAVADATFSNYRVNTQLQATATSSPPSR